RVPVPFHSQVLSNGLPVIGETSPSARSMALGFFVRTGSRDETSAVSGVSHFLEHMVFKGTPNRTALDVNRDFDRIGAHYNAFTSEENTVFYAAILPEYMPQAVDILSDILRPSLRGDDFDMEKNCGRWEAGPIGRQGTEPAKGSGKFEVMAKPKVTQEHVFMISPGPSANDPLRHTADTLALAIGDDSGSRLYWALVDPGNAESADASFHDYEGTGSFYTSFSCDPEQTDENLAVVHEVLAEVQKGGITAEELAQAKSKILSRVVRASERPMGRMQAIGMSWTYLGKYRSVDDELKAFDAVDLKKIAQVMERYPFDELAILALGPLKKLRGPSANGKK